MHKATIIKNLKQILDRNQVKNAQKLARWILETGTTNGHLYLTNTSVPVDTRHIAVSDLRDRLIKAGLVFIKTDATADKWRLELSPRLKYFIDQYKETLSGRVTVSEARIDRLERRLDSLAKYLIDKIEPPFTEEKLSKAITEFEDESKW